MDVEFDLWWSRLDREDLWPLLLLLLESAGGGGEGEVTSLSFCFILCAVPVILLQFVML